MSDLFDAVKYLDALFTLMKGEPGTRKSTCALSYPKPQFWFSLDAKMEAILIPARNWGIKKGDVTSEEFTSYGKIKNKLEALQVTCPFKTIVFDSVTSGGDRINFETLKLKRGSTDQKGQEKGKKIGAITVAGLEEFNAEATFFTELMGILTDIKMYHKVNVIVIGHVMESSHVTDSDRDFIHKSRQLVTGGRKISGKIPAFCGEVYHFNLKPVADLSKGGEYSLLTRHSFSDFARTSLPLDPEIVFNDAPLYDRWILPAIEKLKKDFTTTPQPTTNFEVK